MNSLTDIDGNQLQVYAVYKINWIDNFRYFLVIDFNNKSVIGLLFYPDGRLDCLATLKYSSLQLKRVGYAYLGKPYLTDKSFQLTLTEIPS